MTARGHCGFSRTVVSPTPPFLDEWSFCFNEKKIRLPFTRVERPPYVQAPVLRFPSLSVRSALSASGLTECQISGRVSGEETNASRLTCALSLYAGIFSRKHSQNVLTGFSV